MGSAGVPVEYEAFWMGTSWGTKSPPRLVRMDEPSEVIEPGENQSEDVGEVEQPVPTDTIATTARLRLRRLRDADLADLFALESVEDVWQAFHLGEQPTEEAVGALLQAMIAGQGALGEQSQRHSVAIEELDAPRFVGIIDLPPLAIWATSLSRLPRRLADITTLPRLFLRTSSGAPYAVELPPSSVPLIQTTRPLSRPCRRQGWSRST